MAAEPTRIGVLYPGHAAEDDYATLNERLGDRVAFEVVHTAIGEDAHREDALLDMGSRERLLEGARELAPRGVAAVLWACTSGSFIYGWAGARQQVADVQDALGVPVSSTSLAFVSALRALGLIRVAVAATYPADVARRFERFLADGGFEPVNLTSSGIITAAEVGTIPAEGAVALVAAAEHPDAQAVLVPDTALHTIAAIEELEQMAGKPVLTANQVTAWEGLRLTGRPTNVPALGRLFATVATS